MSFTTTSSRDSAGTGTDEGSEEERVHYRSTLISKVGLFGDPHQIEEFGKLLRQRETKYSFPGLEGKEKMDADWTIEKKYQNCSPYTRTRMETQLKEREESWFPADSHPAVVAVPYDSVKWTGHIYKGEFYVDYEAEPTTTGTPEEETSSSCKNDAEGENQSKEIFASAEANGGSQSQGATEELGEVEEKASRDDEETTAPARSKLQTKKQYRQGEEEEGADAEEKRSSNDDTSSEKEDATTEDDDNDQYDDDAEEDSSTNFWGDRERRPFVTFTNDTRQFQRGLDLLLVFGGKQHDGGKDYHHQLYKTAVALAAASLCPATIFCSDVFDIEESRLDVCDALLRISDGGCAGQQQQGQQQLQVPPVCSLDFLTSHIFFANSACFLRDDYLLSQSITSFSTLPATAPPTTGTTNTINTCVTSNDDDFHDSGSEVITAPSHFIKVQELVEYICQWVSDGKDIVMFRMVSTSFRAAATSQFDLFFSKCGPPMPLSLIRPLKIYRFSTTEMKLLHDSLRSVALSESEGRNQIEKEFEVSFYSSELCLSRSHHQQQLVAGSKGGDSSASSPLPCFLEDYEVFTRGLYWQHHFFVILPRLIQAEEAILRRSMLERETVLWEWLQRDLLRLLEDKDHLDMIIVEESSPSSTTSLLLQQPSSTEVAPTSIGDLFTQGIRNVAAISLATNTVTPLSVPFLLQNSLVEMCHLWAGLGFPLRGEVPGEIMEPPSFIQWRRTTSEEQGELAATNMPNKNKSSFPKKSVVPSRHYIAEVEFAELAYIFVESPARRSRNGVGPNFGSNSTITLSHGIGGGGGGCTLALTSEMVSSLGVWALCLQAKRFPLLCPITWMDLTSTTFDDDSQEVPYVRADSSSYNGYSAREDSYYPIEVGYTLGTSPNMMTTDTTTTNDEQTVAAAAAEEQQVATTSAGIPEYSQAYLIVSRWDSGTYKIPSTVATAPLFQLDEETLFWWPSIEDELSEQVVSHWNPTLQSKAENIMVCAGQQNALRLVEIGGTPDPTSSYNQVDFNKPTVLGEYGARQNTAVSVRVTSYSSTGISTKCGENTPSLTQNRGIFLLPPKMMSHIHPGEKVGAPLQEIHLCIPCVCGVEVPLEHGEGDPLVGASRDPLCPCQQLLQNWKSATTSNKATKSQRGSSKRDTTSDDDDGMGRGRRMDPYSFKAPSRTGQGTIWSVARPGERAAFHFRNKKRSDVKLIFYHGYSLLILPAANMFRKSLWERHLCGYESFPFLPGWIPPLPFSDSSSTSAEKKRCSGIAFSAVPPVCKATVICSTTQDERKIMAKEVNYSCNFPAVFVNVVFGNKSAELVPFPAASAAPPKKTKSLTSTKALLSHSTIPPPLLPSPQRIQHCLKLDHLLQLSKGLWINDTVVRYVDAQRVTELKENFETTEIYSTVFREVLPVLSSPIGLCLSTLFHGFSTTTTSSTVVVRTTKKISSSRRRSLEDPGDGGLIYSRTNRSDATQLILHLARLVSHPLPIGAQKETILPCLEPEVLITPIGWSTAPHYHSSNTSSAADTPSLQHTLCSQAASLRQSTSCAIDCHPTRFKQGDAGERRLVAFNTAIDGSGNLGRIETLLCLSANSKKFKRLVRHFFSQSSSSRNDDTISQWWSKEKDTILFLKGQYWFVPLTLLGAYLGFLFSSHFDLANRAGSLLQFLWQDREVLYDGNPNDADNLADESSSSEEEEKDHTPLDDKNEENLIEKKVAKGIILFNSSGTSSEEKLKRRESSLPFCLSDHFFSGVLEIGARNMKEGRGRKVLLSQHLFVAHRLVHIRDLEVDRVLLRELDLAPGSRPGRRADAGVCRYAMKPIRQRLQALEAMLMYLGGTPVLLKKEEESTDHHVAADRAATINERQRHLQMQAVSERIQRMIDVVKERFVIEPTSLQDWEQGDLCLGRSQEYREGYDISFRRDVCTTHFCHYTKDWKTGEDGEFKCLELLVFLAELQTLHEGTSDLWNLIAKTIGYRMAFYGYCKPENAQNPLERGDFIQKEQEWWEKHKSDTVHGSEMRPGRGNKKCAALEGGIIQFSDMQMLIFGRKGTSISSSTNGGPLEGEGGGGGAIFGGREGVEVTIVPLHEFVNKSRQDSRFGFRECFKDGIIDCAGKLHPNA